MHGPETSEFTGYPTVDLPRYPVPPFSPEQAIRLLSDLEVMAVFTPEEKLLIAIGGTHFRKCDDQAVMDIEGLFQTFMHYTEGADRVVVHEGRRPQVPDNVGIIGAHVRARRSEAATLAWLAREYDVPLLSAEQEPGQEIASLTADGFSPDEIITYDLVRKLTHFSGQSSISPDVLEAYVRTNVLDHALRYADWEYTYGQLEKLYARFCHRPLEINNENDRAFLLDQTSGFMRRQIIGWPTIIQRAAMACNDHRDQYLLHTIKTQLRHTNLFCVAGKAHYHRLAEALAGLGTVLTATDTAFWEQGLNRTVASSIIGKGIGKRLTARVVL